MDDADWARNYSENVVDEWRHRARRDDFETEGWLE